MSSYARSTSDGYTLWLMNYGLANDVSAYENDHSKICLYDALTCNCAICAGVKGDPENSAVVRTATYYRSDDFMCYVNDNCVEPEGVDMSHLFILQDLEMETDTEMTGGVGWGYVIWRF
jgi:hypothetical protein